MRNLLIPAQELPEGFTYPSTITHVIEHGIINLEPWEIMTGEYLLNRHRILKENFPARNLVPFAQRTDNDDLACFDVADANLIRIVHDFASPGWEQRDPRIFNTFHDWLRVAFEDFLAWSDEEADEY